MHLRSKVHFILQIGTARGSQYAVAVRALSSWITVRVYFGKGPSHQTLAEKEKKNRLDGMCQSCLTNAAADTFVLNQAKEETLQKNSHIAELCH